MNLPTYQLAQSYTDADQPLTTQTSTLNPNGSGFTFTNIYDQNLGVLTGLGSTTSTTQANLASLSFTINALLGAFNDQTSSGTSLATETFSYDGDLRPTEETTTWQSGSGNTGTFFDEARSYDAASNVDTETTTMSQPNGQSGTNSMVQNFCYDEQNRLVWAGNSGTQPSPGNGTCGSGTLSNTFSGGTYSSAFVYTHLGQLWQGPLNGTGTNEQYLYCNSGQPHQLSYLVPAGQNYSCSNLPQSVPYTLAYNAWGDANSRTYNNQAATLSYNDFDQMVEWHIPNTNQAWYGYDASGVRTVQHTTVGSTSSTTIYAFGLEEYAYDGSGNLLSSTHYYTLAGHLLGEVVVSGSTSTTNFFLTDGLGSVSGVFSDTAGSAALLSTQLFTPYGTQLVANGNSIGQYTTKGFTGQYNDAVSGLDYYVSRYYDPVAGVFLAADHVQGNPSGMNPYGYVGGNPETNSDPTGTMVANPTSVGGGDSVQQDEQYAFQYVEQGGTARSGLPVLLDLYLNNHQGWVLAESYDENVMHGSTELLLSMLAFSLVHDQSINWDASQALRRMFTQLQGLSSQALAAMQDINQRDPALAAELQQATIASADALMKDASIDASGDFSSTEEDNNTLSTTDNQPTDTSSTNDVTKTTTTSNATDTSTGQKTNIINTSSDKTPIDLYKNGNSKSPRLNNVHPGREYVSDDNPIVPPDRGISTFETQGPGKNWWRLPAGSPIPEGLTLVNDEPGHWLVAPIETMSKDAFVSLAMQMNPFWEGPLTPL